MPYDFTRYAKEIVELVSLSQRPGWNPEHAVKMYLDHAYDAGRTAQLMTTLERMADVSAALEQFKEAYGLVNRVQ